MKAVFAHLDELEAAVGRAVARSEWLTITQERIDAFARVSGDDQWIHVDPERAGRESPYGRTIAHGFLILSLLSRFARDCIELPPARMRINYGFDRVRFVSPVLEGAQIRGAFALDALTRTPDGAQIAWNVDVRIRDVERPALAARWLSRWIGPRP